MKNSIIVTVLILVAAGLVGAGSYYATDVQQTDQIERIHEQRRVAELTHSRVDELLVSQAASAELAEGALERWHSRYKYIPTTLNTADMVEYVESLTRSGFEQFDLSFAGTTEHADFSTFRYNVTGTATYGALYHLVWHLENNREFYRISDLTARHVNVFKKNRGTGLDRRIDMVAFTFKLDAYQSKLDGISAPGENLRPIPLAILQDHSPAGNTFIPLVRTDLPPNDEMLVDVEQAKLISILGQQAVFEDQHGRHVLLEGDRVYLGSIQLVDPVNAFVRVTLNKGDRVETLNLRVIGADEPQSFRTARGNEVTVRPPPAP
jgi:hypothetical protein